MNYTTLEPIVPVNVYEENPEKNPKAKVIVVYKSLSKAALYLNMKVEKVSKLVHGAHKDPVFSKMLNKNVFLRKKIT